MTQPSTQDPIGKVVLGEDLDVLATVPDESVDLVYMDPPVTTGLDGLAIYPASP